MNEQEMREFLATNGDTIAERIREQMIEEITETYRWKMPDTVQSIVSEFMNEKVAPAIREHLKANEGPIIEAAIKSANGVADLVAEKMIENAKENIDGYRFGGLMKSLFE